MVRSRLLATSMLLCGVLAVTVGAQRASSRPPGPDAFDLLVQQNKASIVMLAEKGIVSKQLAAGIARGIVQVASDEKRQGARRSADYLQFEELLVKAAGPEASRLHSGRSRQDLGSTSDRLQQREALLNLFASTLTAREKLLAFAAKNQDTVIPAYTHGVQAQPTTLAHYILAFSSALERDADRLSAAYKHINLSPLGAAALATSGFPVDRERLAVLLGFDGVVQNSYDANHVSPADIKTGFAGAVASGATHVGQFVEDLHIQYHDPQPWLLLEEGELTGISSIMPQKRNPSALERLRGLSSRVVGDAQTVFLIAHNTSTGMSDYRGSQQIVRAAEGAREMYELYARVVESLVVNADRSLREVNDDYATMTEVADTLQREADIPFRIGHHFASEMTTYGRAKGKRPTELTYPELQAIYKEATHGQALPLSETQMKQALDPKYVVSHRNGLGGSQPAEVTRMLTDQKAQLAARTAWLTGERQRLSRADADLEKPFTALTGSPTSQAGAAQR
jgi:argininosuccinate lyase